MKELSETLINLYRNIFRGTVSVGIGNFTLLILGILSTMVAVRQLSLWDFGSFILLQTIAALLAQISSMGLETAGARYISGSESDFEKIKYIHTVLASRIVIFCAFSVLYFAFHQPINSLFGTTEREIIFPVICLFFLQSMLGQFKSILQGLFRFKYIGVGSVIESTLNFILILWLVLLLKMGFWGLLYSKMIAQSISCGYFFLCMPKSRQTRIDTSTLITLIRFGFPLEINELLGFIYQRFDTILTGILLTPTEIAYLAVARKIPDSLSGLFEAFRSVYFPYISQLGMKKEWDTVAHAINQVIRALSFVAFLLCLAIVFWGSSIIKFLFTGEYLASTTLFQVLMVALSLGFINNVFGTSLVAIGQSNKPPIINALHSATSLVSNLILIPRIGIIGAGISSLLGNLISNPLNYFFLMRSKIDVSVKNYLIPITIFCTCGVLYLINPQNLLFELVILCLYIGLSLIFMVIKTDDLMILWKIRPRYEFRNHKDHLGVKK